MLCLKSFLNYVHKLNPQVAALWPKAVLSLGRRRGTWRHSGSQQASAGLEDCALAPGPPGADRRLGLAEEQEANTGCGALAGTPRDWPSGRHSWSQRVPALEPPRWRSGQVLSSDPVPSFHGDGQASPRGQLVWQSESFEASGEAALTVPSRNGTGQITDTSNERALPFTGAGCHPRPPQTYSDYDCENDTWKRT